MSETQADPIRIVILDKHSLVRTGMRLIIQNQPGMEVVGESGNAQKGLELVANLKPDIVLIGIILDGTSGLELIPMLLSAWRGARLILVTGSDQPTVHLQAIKNGVLGIVLKTEPPEVLTKAIQKVHAGEAWIEHSLIASLLTSFSHMDEHSATDPKLDRIARLSDRERRVIQLIGRGMKNQQIADQMNIAEVTVRHHLTTIYNKLGVADRLELLIFAFNFSLTELNGNQENPNR